MMIIVSNYRYLFSQKIKINFYQKILVNSKNTMDCNLFICMTKIFYYKLRHINKIGQYIRLYKRQ